MMCALIECCTAVSAYSNKYSGCEVKHDVRSRILILAPEPIGEREQWKKYH